MVWLNREEKSWILRAEGKNRKELQELLGEPETGWRKTQKLFSSCSFMEKCSSRRDAANTVEWGVAGMGETKKKGRRLFGGRSRGRG